nr:DUF2066 domain-containing protein [Echinimonas agarilytica]
MVCPFWASAVEVANLYTARVDAKLKLNDGLAQAFDQVIVRNSGHRDSLANVLVSQQRSKVKDYLVQYGNIDEGGKRWLEVAFNQEAIDRLLRQANLPIWGSLRPMTIVWLVEEENFKRELLNDQSPILQDSELKVAARSRGVPLMLPLLDLDDISTVDPSDIWGQFPGPARQASARYSADQMVMAKLFSIGAEQYQLQWSVYDLSGGPLDVQPAWMSNALTGDKQTLMMEWLEQMADEFGAHFATQTGLVAADSVQVIVYNLSDLKRVLEAESSLAGMAIVSQVELQQIDGNQAVFNVNLLGPSDDFYRALELDKRLDALEVAPEELPSYMWKY